MRFCVDPGCHGNRVAPCTWSSAYSNSTLQLPIVGYEIPGLGGGVWKELWLVNSSCCFALGAAPKTGHCQQAELYKTNETVAKAVVWSAHFWAGWVSRICNTEEMGGGL